MRSLSLKPRIGDLSNQGQGRLLIRRLSLRRGIVERRINTLFAGGLLALTLFDRAIAAQLVDGWLAYQRSDYVEALRIWVQLADQGLAGAQFNLGFMYANGRGVPQDYEQALFWYRKAADQGYAYAQDEVGSMYAKGQGVPQNDEQADIWFTWLRHVKGKRPFRSGTVMTWRPK